MGYQELQRHGCLPGIEVPELSTGQPHSLHQQARTAIDQTLADWPTVGVLLPEPYTSKQALVQGICCCLLCIGCGVQLLDSSFTVMFEQ